MNPKVFIRSMILMVITFIAISVFWFTQKSTSSKTQYPDTPTLLDDDNPYASLFIPSFRLMDTQGNTIDESILKGKYTVVDFFYTSCPLICPGMSAAMRQIQNETTETDLQLLSISIDPEFDTTQVIKTYSENYSADPTRWQFANGPPEMIDLILAGVGFDLTDLNTDEGFRNIGHPSTILLIGPDLHAIKLYRYSDPDQIDELIKTAHELAG